MAGAKAPLRLRGRLERELFSQKLNFAGVDEVGRGCLAGPVHAGCAILDWPRFRRLPASVRALVRDSKQLTAAQREQVVPKIIGLCSSWAVASATVEEINELGIVPSTFLAMRRAISSCDKVDVLLVDGKYRVPGYLGRQEALIKGDTLSYSIAAASILAKTARDQHMRDLAATYPDYGFEQHVGYGTQAHLASIAKYGVCPLHRKTFAPIRDRLAEL